MMRRMFFLAAIALVLVSLGAGASHAQGTNSITGFAGFTANSSSMQPLFGVNAAFGLTPNIQVFGEAGWINDITPSLVDRLVELTPADLRVSTFYGEGGVRLLTESRAPLAGYLDASAGFARLSTRLSGTGAADPFVNTALRFLDRTSPTLGVGGGVLLGVGPALVDIGYRYKRIIDNNPVDQLLTLGSGNLNVHQVRIAVGARF